MSISSRLFRATSVALFGFAAGCSSVTEEDRAKVAEVASLSAAGSSEAVDGNAPGRLIMFRVWNGEGLAFLGTGPKVEIDGREVGRCLLGDGTTISLTAGEHEIRAPHSEVSGRRFRIQPGQTIYAECKYTVGVFVPNVQFEFSATRDRKK